MDWATVPNTSRYSECGVQGQIGVQAYHFHRMEKHFPSHREAGFVSGRVAK